MKKKNTSNTDTKKFPKFTGQKKVYYDGLMQIRAQVQDQLRVHSDEALNAQKDSAGERAGMATHMADLGSDNFRHDLELGLLTNESEILEMIEEAIARLESGEFGNCMDCNKEIAEERLQIKPYARFCTKCTAVRESRGASSL
ncbi:MAG: hypothetical protein A2X49_00640 [Lentisphaerae bacterium GWF2_52_8]|nr:MAG: hypothetical protein A2X49_00640 [Lentisphaerae bacterium GWF2_52_8]